LLPNLLIIGAAKCGTTSLHEYLRVHPEISMSARKELKFFTQEEWHERVAWYRAQFPETAPVRGESSPGYTMFPFLPSVAERVYRLIPAAKLIYVVRDPVERTVANYVEFFALRFEDRPIEAALADVDDPANPHICPSRYATQLEQFLEYFDPGQILVLDREDLLHRRDTTLMEIFTFLGVDPGFVSPEFRQLHNARTVKVRYGPLGSWLVRRGILTRSSRSFPRGPLVAPFRQLLSRPVETTLSASTRQLLVEVLGPEVDRLRELTGKDFSAWPSFPREPSNEGLHTRVPPA